MTPYRWLHRLGSGSSGVVWAVERDGREFAVKVLRSTSNPAHAEAILRETRIGPMIAEHPGIVAVRHVETVNGVLHLEMDQVRGPSLAQVLRGRIDDRLGPIPASVAVPWAMQVLDALHWVGRRVVPLKPESFAHRDIKPANLLLDPSGRVRITDFGIARAEAELGFQTTQTGIVKGSPRYMAPEVILEKAPDARSDQFSMGVVLFELITGVPLYVGRDLAEVLLLAVNADVEKRLALVPGPRELVDLMRRMLAKDREQRFRDHAAALEALRGLRLAGPTVHDLLPDMLGYGEGESDDEGTPIIDERTGDVTNPVLDVDMDLRTDPGLVPHASETMTWLGPPNTTVQSVHRPAALPTMSPFDEVPTPRPEVFDEMDPFAEPDVTTDIGDVREVTPSVRPLDSLPLLDPRMLAARADEGPTELMFVPPPEPVARPERPPASEAPTAVLSRRELLRDYDREASLDPPTPQRPARRTATPALVSRRTEAWLVIVGLLVVVLGALGAVLIVAFAVWWNSSV